MLVIHKYAIPLNANFSLLLPEGTEILHLDSQYGKPVMWVLSRPTNPDKIRKFLVRGTGHTIDRGYDELEFLGTIKLEEETFILHLFEEKEA